MIIRYIEMAKVRVEIVGQYVVKCTGCGKSFSPTIRSKAWKVAHDQAILDKEGPYLISPALCGCKK